MEEPRTVADIILEAVQVLDSITLPVALVEAVGMPVARVSGNLKACLRAFEEERNKAAAKAAKEGQDK